MKTALLFTQLLLLPLVNWACSCLSYGSSFFQSLHTGHRTCVVVFDSTSYATSSGGYRTLIGHFSLVSPINWGHTSASVVVKGESEGLSCVTMLGHFQAGDTLILALEKYPEAHGNYLYYTEACGKYYLKIKNGNAEGYTLAQLIKKITQQVTGMKKYGDLQENLQLFPNPSASSFTLLYTEPLQQIRIVNAQGQEIFATKTDESYFTVDLSPFIKGLYYVTVQTANGMATKTVVRD